MLAFPGPSFTLMSVPKLSLSEIKSCFSPLIWNSSIARFGNDLCNHIQGSRTHAPRCHELASACVVFLLGFILVYVALCMLDFQ